MDLAIIVSSCDKFKDCWEPFIFAFNKMWPDCPYPRYIVSNHKKLENSGGFEFICVGDDWGWASNLKAAIEIADIKAEYLLYMQEDYWLTTPISTPFIEKEIEYAVQNNIDYLRLTFPWMDQYKIDEFHANSPLDIPYSICLQSAIWKKDTFGKFLQPGWTGWDFEAKIVTLDLSGFKAQVLLEKVARARFHYCDAVRKGRWTQIGAKFLKQYGFENLLSQRDREGLFYTMFDRLTTMRITRRFGKLLTDFMRNHKLEQL